MKQRKDTRVKVEEGKEGKIREEGNREERGKAKAWEGDVWGDLE